MNTKTKSTYAVIIMKKFSLSASFLLGLVTVSLQAGEPVTYKQVAPPPPQLYGMAFMEQSTPERMSIKT